MSAIDPIGNGVTSQLVSMALDGALARHAAIATNIANVSTPDYQPVMARFDQLVEQLQGRVEDRSLDSATERVVGTLKDSLEREPLALDPRASKVELDVQMAYLAKNTLRYQALLTAQSKLSAMRDFVISEGKF
jgi:flagellar basal-body rod protein FlgB